MLTYTRILFPGSKRSSLKDSQKLYVMKEDIDLQHVYRTLDILVLHSDEIQAEIYKTVNIWSIARLLSFITIVPIIFLKQIVHKV